MNRFNKYPRTTLFSIIIVFMLAGLLLAEIFLQTFTGLGNPVLYEINPLYGYRPAPNQRIEPKGGMGFLYASKVTINNLGLRAAEDWNADPSKKILFLGDSVTYGGQYIDAAQLFTTIAANSLPGWTVGNGGVNAWGVENIAGLVLDEGFHPAEVIVTCLIEGDFYRGTTRISSLPFWVDPPRFALQDLLMHIIWKMNESRYGSSIDYTGTAAEIRERIVNRSVERLKEMHDFLASEGFQHFIFILPSRSQVIENEEVDEVVFKALQRQEVPVQYILFGLNSAEAQDAWFHDEVHLESAGHVVYGELIGKSIREHLDLN